MNSLSISFVIFLNLFLICASEKKCCKTGQHIVEKHSVYTCENLVNLRLQENFEKKDFLSENVTGNCLDILSGENVVKFHFDEAEGKIDYWADYGESFFPKCCPVGSSYNSTTHGCQENPEENLEILQINSFVRVGLQKCKIISDKILDSIHEVKMDVTNELTLIKEGRRLTENFCVDSTLDGKLAVRICEEDIQICSKVMCIHKCCPDGQSFINGSQCRDTFVHGVDLHFTETIHSPDEPFVLIHGFGSKIYPLYENRYKYYIDRFGTFVSYLNTTNSYQYSKVNDNGYCVEYVLKNKNQNVVTMDGYFMFAQGKKQPIEPKFLVTRWCKIISCIFLLLTISVYLLLPKIRNLFGKILLSYCVSTFIFFFVLVISQFYSDGFRDGMCKFIGFISVLASIWSFTWLHIMCIDIWSSFGYQNEDISIWLGFGQYKEWPETSLQDFFSDETNLLPESTSHLRHRTPRTLSGPLQKKEWKRLLLYSLYGWGFPILWVAMIAVFSVTTFMPEAIQPIIGERKCYLENSDGRPGNYSYLLYVTFPLLIQQIINTTLFIKTILYCLKIKAEVERMNDSEKRTALNASKERLGLIMKLAVIMGVLFIFETVSSLYNFRRNEVTKYIEVVWDSINCLQGVYIFLIFICKKKVFDSVCEKFPTLKSRKTSVSSSATTQISMHNINGTKREKTP